MLRRDKQIGKDTAMSDLGTRIMKCLLNGREVRLITTLILVLILQLVTVSPAGENESVHHYKMISSVEYTGKSQFSNRTETLFTIRKETFSDNEDQYVVSGKDLNPDLTQESSLSVFSFILDKNTRSLSGTDKDMDFWTRVNNESVKSLREITKDNIGKTWKQSFNLTSIGKPLPDEFNFTLTAREFETEIFGRMIAVRALSEPFFIKTGNGSVSSRINAVYLFDPEIEDIYLSVSVFEGETKAYGFKESLRHEVATYRTDAVGTSFDLTGLDDRFKKLVQKVGLSRKPLEVNQKAPLPRWARSEGLMASQAANICVAMACEGALNPVVTVFIPTVRMMGMQSTSRIPSIGQFAMGDTVGGALGKSVPGLRTMKIAVHPGFFHSLGAAHYGLGTAAAAGGVAIAGDKGDSDSHRRASPF